MGNRAPTLVDGNAAAAVGVALCERLGTRDEAGVERSSGAATRPAAAGLLNLPPAVRIFELDHCFIYETYVRIKRHAMRSLFCVPELTERRPQNANAAH